MLEQVHALGLDSLKKGRTTVHFSPGYQDRAIRLASRVNRALLFYADTLNAELEEFHLVLANRKDWKILTEHQTYGVPKSMGAWQRDNLEPEQVPRLPLPPAAIVPADAKGAVYDQLLPMKECLTPSFRDPLESIGITWKEASRIYVELITFHEVAHLITDTEAYHIDMPTGWYREYLANFLSYAYLYHTEPNNARIWDLMPEVTLECYTPKFRTLEDLMLGKIDAYDYHWYQSRFIQRANRVVENRGTDFIHKAQKLFPAESPGKTLSEKTEAVYNNMDSMSEKEAARGLKKINEELINRLEEIAPGFKAWAEGFSEIEKSQ
ncbi:MAG: hypothetical protein KGY60_00540 [Bacteroidales bacterium]|nr:hypothetical protein [Bacteroidales bacterium]